MEKAEQMSYGSCLYSLTAVLIFEENNELRRLRGRGFIGELFSAAELHGKEVAGEGP